LHDFYFLLKIGTDEHASPYITLLTTGFSFCINIEKAVSGMGLLAHPFIIIGLFLNRFISILSIILTKITVSNKFKSPITIFLALRF